MDEKLLSQEIEIDDNRDIVTICGVKYAGGLFRGLGFRATQDDYFQIVSRNDGVLTIKQTRIPAYAAL